MTRNPAIDVSPADAPAGRGSAASVREGSYRRPIRAGLSRSVFVAAFLLSLLLHGLVILALLDTEKPPADAARATIVTVDLAASQPAAPPPPPSVAASSSESPAASRTGPEEMHERGNEPPRVEAKSPLPRTAPAPTAPVRALVPAKTRTAARPAPKSEMPSAAPRFDEAPGNRAFDSPSAYLRLLAIRLAEVKRYPLAAVAQREEGVVLLAFRLDRSGRVLSWEIARSSGHDELDAEVSRMVALAAPFPPFPTSWREASASFQVPIGFSLY